MNLNTSTAAASPVPSVPSVPITPAAPDPANSRMSIHKQHLSQVSQVSQLPRGPRSHKHPGYELTKTYLIDIWDVQMSGPGATQGAVRVPILSYPGNNEAGPFLLAVFW